MAKIPHFEQPTGSIDNLNQVFTTSTPYIPGSVVVFVRGIPRVAAWDDGWTETDPAAGTITLKEPPCEGDDVQIMWCEDGPDVPLEEVTPLIGIIESADLGICGKMCDSSSFTACIEPLTVELCGSLQTTCFSAQISTLSAICGIISEYSS